MKPSDRILAIAQAEIEKVDKRFLTIQECEILELKMMIFAIVKYLDEVGDK